MRLARWLNAAHQPALENRVVLVDFWSMNCAPCVANLPHVAAIAQRFKSMPLTIITIHPDVIGVREKGIAGNVVWATKPAEEALLEFVSRRQVALPVGIDDRHLLATSYALDAVPTYFLVDRRGIVRFESHDLPTDADVTATLAN